MCFLIPLVLARQHARRILPVQVAPGVAPSTALRRQQLRVDRDTDGRGGRQLTTRVYLHRVGRTLLPRVNPKASQRIEDHPIPLLALTPLRPYLRVEQREESDGHGDKGGQRGDRELDVGASHSASPFKAR